MKKAFLMTLACLLLAGCGAPAETAAPAAEMPADSLPETAPAEPNPPAGSRTRGAHLRPRRGDGGAGAGRSL